MANLPSSVSPYIDWQFPEFVRENHTRFLEFIRSYYQWMESQGQVIHETKSLPLNQDIDTTTNEYVERHFREFLANIPRNIVSDKSTLLKHIKQFYRARGTEKSYKLFFRFLYDLNVEFYYPRVDVLRVSDGKWIQQKAIRVFEISGSAFNLRSQRIRGRTNNSTAYVERVFKISEGNFTGYELILNVSSITGAFLPEEVVESETGNITARISAVPTAIHIKKAGEGYSPGMKFTINQIGYGAEIQVQSVSTSGAIEKLTITNYGLGYFSANPIKNFVLTATVLDQAIIDVDLGALINYGGYYLNEDGQVSTLKYIHDGHYYQQFSYVLLVGETLQTYEPIVKKLLHPAGFKLFGGFRSENVVDGRVEFLAQNTKLMTRRLTSDIIDATTKIHTSLIARSQVVRANNTPALGPTNQTLYHNRYNYKPFAKYDANLDVPTLVNYFGNSGDTSVTRALTPVSVFEAAGITPANAEVKLYERTNILPDAVIHTEEI